MNPTPFRATFQAEKDDLYFLPAAAASAFLASAICCQYRFCGQTLIVESLTCGLLSLHDGGDVRLVGRLLGTSLGVLVLLLKSQYDHLSIYDSIS